MWGRMVIWAGSVWLSAMSHTSDLFPVKLREGEIRVLRKGVHPHWTFHPIYTHHRLDAGSGVFHVFIFNSGNHSGVLWMERVKSNGCLFWLENCLERKMYHLYWCCPQHSWRTDQSHSKQQYTTYLPKYLDGMMTLHQWKCKTPSTSHLAFCHFWSVFFAIRNFWQRQSEHSLLGGRAVLCSVSHWQRLNDAAKAVLRRSWWPPDELLWFHGFAHDPRAFI